MNINQFFKNGIYNIKSSKAPVIDEIVYLVNSNCDFSYDSSSGFFTNSNDLKLYTVELEIVYEDIDDYIAEKSNNGGHYAFAEAKVKAILE